MSLTHLTYIGETAAAIISHGAVTYIGTLKGNILRMNNVTKVLTNIGKVQGEIRSLSINYPLLYITDNEGNITTYTISSSDDPSTSYGTAVIDFGATLTDEATLVITNMPAMKTTSRIIVFIEEDDTTSDNNAEAHKSLASFSTCHATSRVAGVGFTAAVRLWNGYASGTFKINYIYGE